MQNRKSVSLISMVSLIGIAAGAAEASYIAKITADNHYAIYVDAPGGVTLVGGNELGAGGSPGTYNWSRAETFTFDTSNHIYIAVWSDDAVAQGLLADIRDTNTGALLHTGVAPWEVMVTGVTKGDGSPQPSGAEIAMYSAQADANDEWLTPYVGPKNLSSTAPWGLIAGIDEEARWTWGNPFNAANPLIGGTNHVEYQIFRIDVPTPGTIGLASLGFLATARRRRR